MGQKIKHRQQKLPKRFGSRDMLSFKGDSSRDQKRNEKKQKFQEEEFCSDLWTEEFLQK